MLSVGTKMPEESVCWTAGKRSLPHRRGPWDLDVSRTRVRNQRRTTNPATRFCDAPCMGHLLGYAYASRQRPATPAPGRSSRARRLPSGVHRDCWRRPLPPAASSWTGSAPGDTLVVSRLDCLGRSLRHLVDTVTSLAERGIAFRNLQEATETTTPAASSSPFLCGPDRARMRPHPRTNRCGGGRRQSPRPPRRPAPC